MHVCVSQCMLVCACKGTQPEPFAKATASAASGQFAIWLCHGKRALPGVASSLVISLPALGVRGACSQVRVGWCPLALPCTCWGCCWGAPCDWAGANNGGQPPYCFPLFFSEVVMQNRQECPHRVCECGCCLFGVSFLLDPLPTQTVREL